ncbi:MAG: hypothetical protein HUU06_13910, partial [Planctomycetaceae bacterium]|nr:hypothetical protein [Planctomycetaceae bacterium]
HEVQGTVECEKPLAAPGQAGDCVWYRFTIVEEYQERTHHPRRGSQTRDVSETVLDRQEAVPFLLKDESGSIRVDPEGAHLDGKLVRGSAEDTTGNMVLPEMTLGGSRRLKGRRREIRLIPVGGPGYVLGRCVERDGVLVLARDELEAKPFVVSCRSERELLAGHELGLKAKLLLAVGGAVLGAASLLAAWGG